jgi:hypothetical protein
MSEIHYTITSSESDDYSTIRSSLISPSTPMTEFMITGLTTVCSFTILDRTDYITIEKFDPTDKEWYDAISICPSTQYTTMNLKTLIKIFNDLFANNAEIVFVELPSSDRFAIRSLQMEIYNNLKFRITDMSYRMKLITGLYSEKFPLEAETFYMIIGDERKNGPLGIEDYIEINGVKYHPKEFVPIVPNNAILLNVMRKIVPHFEFRLVTDDKELGIIRNSDIPFEITGISENMADLTGFKAKKACRNYAIRAVSSGYYQLTPVLYLTSNIGTTCYTYDGKECTNQKILMRINNHFVPGQPIVTYNFDFSTKIQSNALSDVWFKLVDANFQSVKLLNPMYLSAISMGMNERQIEKPILYDEYNLPQE